MARLGINQLRLLIMTASPTCLLLTPDKASAALVRRGLFEDRSGACAITPAGLRALADEMEAGRVDDALTAMRKDRAETDARNAARRAARQLRETQALARDKGLV